MKWIHGFKYFGPDRRNRRSWLRIFDRRRQTLATDPPTTLAALRQLRLRAMDVNSEEGLAQFRDRLPGLIALTAERKASDVEAILRGIAEALPDNPQDAGALRSWLDNEIARATGFAAEENNIAIGAAAMRV